MAVSTDIKRLLERPDPLLSFKWVAAQELLPYGLPSSYLEGINIPFLNIKIQDGIFAGASYNYFPGFHDISPFNMTLYEDHFASTLKWLTAWKMRVKNLSTGAYNLPIEYKQDFKIQLLDAKNNIVLTVNLQGIWPADTNALDLNYTESNRVIISQTFSVDSQEII